MRELCTATECKRKDCPRYWQRVQQEQKNGVVQMGDYSKICRKYIADVIEEVEERDHSGGRA